MEKKGEHTAICFSYIIKTASKYDYVNMNIYILSMFSTSCLVISTCTCQEETRALKQDRDEIQLLYRQVKQKVTYLTSNIEDLQVEISSHKERIKELELKNKSK